MTSSDDRFGRLGYRVGRLSFRLTHPFLPVAAPEQPQVRLIDPTGPVQPEPVRAPAKRRGATERARAHEVVRGIHAVPVIRTGVGQVLGPHGASVLDRTVRIGSATAARTGGHGGPHDWHVLVLDAIPAVVGLAAFATTRNLLQANAVGLTSATALHLFRLLWTHDEEAAAHPVVIGAAAGSVGLLAAALTFGSVGGVLGVVAPTPAGWALIGLGVAAGVAVSLLLEGRQQQTRPPHLLLATVR